MPCAFNFAATASRSKPLHQQTAYRDYPIAGNGLSVSEHLSEGVLSLPMHPYLDESVQDRIVSAIASILQ